MNVRSCLIGLAACCVLVGSASADVVVMGENSDGSATNNSYSKGNTVTVDTAVDLEGMGLYLENVPANTNLLWAVYESDTVSGTYNLVHEVMQPVAGGSGYFDSPAMSVPLIVGKYYFLGGFWDQPVTYFFSNTLPGGPLYFDYGSGTMTYHERQGAFTTFPGPPQFAGGGSTNAPYWQRYTLGGEPGVGYCFGDAGSGTPCPCGNDNDGSVPESGCANGVFASGAQLTGSGAASVSGDTLVLATTGLEPNNAGLYFQADNDLSPGIVWGDGLQCAGGSLKRLGVRFADGTGYSDTSGYPQSISVKAGNVLAGDTKRYQCWYRNIIASPCGADFNASNGYEVVWTP